MRILAFALIALAAVAACSGASSSTSSRHGPAALRHDAYVWQRAWTGSVRAAVANAPPELSGLRVLTLEVSRDGTHTWPAVRTDSLLRANRPITAVVRIDGSRLPADISLTPVIERIVTWRAAGVPVAGIEVDHDCATAALADYAAWLAAQRPPDLRYSITALPTWADAPPPTRTTLTALGAVVDEIVLQVHAVQAPTIFDAASARRWVAQFAAALPAETALRVALPTYKVALGAAHPDDVAAFLRTLEREPIAAVTGIVWFRLPIAADRAAWPAPVLAAVIRGAPHSHLVETSHVR